MWVSRVCVSCVVIYVRVSINGVIGGNVHVFVASVAIFVATHDVSVVAVDVLLYMVCCVICVIVVQIFLLSLVW